MTVSEIQKLYRDRLSTIYDEREARSISNLVFEKVLELQSYKLSLERFQVLTTHQMEVLEQILNRLIEHEPVQYVLEEADFNGLKFYVNKHVLIPRPETEELVNWVAKEVSGNYFRLLDIGTGSGCIAISLGKESPDAVVEAIDVSPEALQVAEENNSLNKTDVKFRQMDILSQKLEKDTYDVIVSNPPYINESEATGMAANVLKYEPRLALFTDGDDDLIFYKEISRQAISALKPHGLLFFEINGARGKAVVEIIKAAGFTNVELRKDLSGKDRMVKATK